MERKTKKDKQSCTDRQRSHLMKQYVVVVIAKKLMWVVCGLLPWPAYMDHHSVSCLLFLSVCPALLPHLKQLLSVKHTRLLPCSFLPPPFRSPSLNSTSCSNKELAAIFLASLLFYSWRTGISVCNTSRHHSLHLPLSEYLVQATSWNLNTSIHTLKGATY